jgi:hypothetical protein
MLGFQVTQPTRNPGRATEVDWRSQSCYRVRPLVGQYFGSSAGRVFREAVNPIMAGRNGFSAAWFTARGHRHAHQAITLSAASGLDLETILDKVKTLGEFEAPAPRTSE